MSHSSISLHISQSLDILHHLPPQIVFNPHIIQFRLQRRDLGLSEERELGRVVDAKLGHDAGCCWGADTVERGERFLGGVSCNWLRCWGDEGAVR